MGQEELQTLADLIAKPKAKLDWIKIAIMIVSSTVCFWFVGSDMQEWKDWRKEISTNVEKQGETIQSLSKESIKNQVQRHKNDTSGNYISSRNN